MDASLASLRFDGIEIDFAGHRLRRDGVEQHLEPRAFAVLALLAEQPGRVVARDAILDAVWGHRHVTPGTLNRLITLLRQALGESAGSPRYLHTVHGLGYRLDLPGPGVAADASEAGPERALGDRAGAPDSGSAGAAEIPAAADLVLARSRARRPGWLLLVLALGVLAGALLWRLAAPGQGPARESSARRGVEALPGMQGTVPVLAVLPLRSAGGLGAHAEFAEGLSEELIDRLARAEGLRVISRTSSFQFREPNQSLPEVARRLGATHLLEGSVRQEGERLRVALRLVDGARDRTLWSETYEQEWRDLFAVQDRIAAAVGRSLRLGLGLESGRAHAVDIAVYRRFLIARRHFNELPEGRAGIGGVRDELLALTRDAPDFASAWGLLALLQWVQAVTGPEAAHAAVMAEVEVALQRALALDPEEPYAQTVRANQACIGERWSECLRRSQRLVDRFPADSMLRHGHARRLAAMGYVDQALREVDEALARDPLSWSLPYFRALLLFAAGRDLEMEAASASLDRSVNNSMHLIAAVRRGDCATARERAESMPAAAFAYYRESQLAAAEACTDPSQWPRVARLVESSERQAAPDRARFNYMRFVLPERDHAREMAELVRIKREGRLDIHLILWRPDEAGLRRSPAFRRYVRESGLLDLWREHGSPAFCGPAASEASVCT